MSQYYAQTPVPCPCGSTLAYWHRPSETSSVYCCDACWLAMPGNGTRLPDDVIRAAVAAAEQEVSGE